MKTATKAFSLSIGLTVGILLCNPQSFAGLITFTHTGVGSGTIGTKSFTNASFTITDVGDTASRRNLGFGFSIDDISASISIAGLGNFNFTSGTRTFVNNPYSTVGFSGADEADLFDGPTAIVFRFWDMLSSIGPITGSGYLMQWSPPYNNPVTTDGGTLIFNDATCDTVFTAVIPEPGTALLVGLSFVGLLAISQRKKWSHQFQSRSGRVALDEQSGRSKMKRIYRSLISTVSGSAMAFALSTSQVLAITVDGSLDGDYGSALSVQTINTGFGDSNYGGINTYGSDANGSELDAAYGLMRDGNLYLFIAGNSEANGNHVNVFIDAGLPGGQNTLNINSGWWASIMSGSVFSPGFNANLMIDANDYHGTLYLDQYILQSGGSVNTYLGNFALTSGIGNGTLGGITIGLNNSNIGGVTLNPGGSAADQAAAQAVTTGWELAIPLSLLGNPTQVKVLAVQNGFKDIFLSNQFLPGLPVGTGNVGGGGPYSGANTSSFNLSSRPNGYFEAVPEPSTIGLVMVGLLGAVFIRRRK